MRDKDRSFTIRKIWKCTRRIVLGCNIYLKGLTSINHFVVDPSHENGLNKSMRLRLEGATREAWNLVSSQYYLTIYHRFWLSVPPLNPHNRHTVTIFGGRYRQYPIDGMLFQSSLICIIKFFTSYLASFKNCSIYVKYLWLNKVLNRRGKLWTCSRHVKARSRKIIHIDHVERTITLFTIYALLLSIRRIDFSNFAD